MSWAVSKWLIAAALFAIAAWIVHDKASSKVELGPHLARVVSICLVASVFYPLKELLGYLTWAPFTSLDPIPVAVEVLLVVVFLGALVYYLGSTWKSRDDEGLMALRVPSLALAVLLLLVGCGVLMWR